jgi:hypothetical protein
MRRVCARASTVVTAETVRARSFLPADRSTFVGTFESEECGSVVDGFWPATILPWMFRQESTVFATTRSVAAWALDNEMFLPRVTGNPEECTT